MYERKIPRRETVCRNGIERLLIREAVPALPQQNCCKQDKYKWKEYRQDPGFSVDIEEYCKGAYKVYTTDQLIAFLKDVANGVDSLAELRNEACHIANYSNDGKNAERVTDFILKTSGVSV